MKLHHTKYKVNYKNFILDCLDVAEQMTRQERIEYLFNRFNNEYGFNIKRMGKRKALAEWLSGLAIPIPFSNWDILNLAKKMGSVDEELTPKQEDKIIQGYWDFMANMILLLENEIEPSEEEIAKSLIADMETRILKRDYQPHLKIN